MGHCFAVDCMIWWVTTTLTHWGRVTHICVSKLTIIGSDNGLTPDRRQAIIWTNDGLLFIGPLGTNFSEILIEILTFLFKKMRLKMSSAKWRPFCPGLNVLTHWGQVYIDYGKGLLLVRFQAVTWNLYCHINEIRTQWVEDHSIHCMYIYSWNWFLIVLNTAIKDFEFEFEIEFDLTSSNGNIFRVTGHLFGEFTGPRWIPRTKASDAELWCFLWSASE